MKKNYYEIGGDRYDMGVVFRAYVDGKRVANQVLNGDEDFEYNKKKYDNITKVMAAIAKDAGLKTSDFKRMQLEGANLSGRDLQEAGLKKNYYEIGGDRYDMGVVFRAYVDGKRVANQVLNGDEDFEFNKKKYDNITKVIAAIAAQSGLKTSDFKRMQLEGANLSGRDLQEDFEEVILDSVDFVEYVVNKKPQEFSDAVSEALYSRVRTAIEVLRQDVASDLFGESVNA